MTGVWTYVICFQCPCSWTPEGSCPITWLSRLMRAAKPSWFTGCSQNDSSWGPCFSTVLHQKILFRWGLALHELCLTYGRCVIVIWGHYLICKPCPTSDSACGDKPWGSAYVISGAHGWRRCFIATQGKLSIFKKSSQSLMSLQVPSNRLLGGILYSTQNSYVVGPRTEFSLFCLMYLTLPNSSVFMCKVGK